MLTAKELSTCCQQLQRSDAKNVPSPEAMKTELTESHPGRLTPIHEHRSRPALPVMPHHSPLSPPSHQLDSVIQCDCGPMLPVPWTATKSDNHCESP